MKEDKETSRPPYAKRIEGLMRKGYDSIQKADYGDKTGDSQQGFKDDRKNRRKYKRGY